MTDIVALQSDILAQVTAAADEAALEALRVGTLGKKGSVSALLATMGSLSPEDRKVQGPLFNGLRDTVTQAIAARKTELADAALDARLAGETLDVTLPARPENSGTVHPISQVLDEVVAIFAELGFGVAEGPDVEFDDYNFTKLNIPPDHPARQMQDTFYVAPQKGDGADGSSHVLRTHTSPVQVRTMLNTKPPIRIISPGRTYRVDSDATHSPMFHQVEALVVDEGIHLGHLKWTVDQFCKAFFEIDKIELRARPSFFPFTEPSLEWDMRCDRSVPGKITFGSGKDWLELGGAGMVHPNVLRNLKYDPAVLSGWAFGFGLERIALKRYGIDDIRRFFENAPAFLKQLA